MSSLKDMKAAAKEGRVQITTLCDEDKKKLVHDLDQLFSGTAAGHCGEHFYSNPAFDGDPCNGAEIFEEIRASINYYPRESETKLFKEIEGQLNKTLRQSEYFVSLGGGSKEAFTAKDLKVLKASGASTAYLIDISGDSLQQQRLAIEEAKKRGELSKDIKVIAIKDDFQRAVKDLNFDYNVTVAMTGLTLFNMETRDDEYDGNNYLKMIKTIEALTENMPLHSTFVITQDTNTNTKSVERAYNHPILIPKWVESFIHYVNRELETEGLTPDLFIGQAPFRNNVYNQTELQMIATRDAEFTIEGKKYRVKKGEVFVPMISKKAGITSNIDIVADAFRKAGLRPDGVSRSEGDNTSVVRYFSKGRDPRTPK